MSYTTPSENVLPALHASTGHAAKGIPDTGDAAGLAEPAETFTTSIEELAMKPKNILPDSTACTDAENPELIRPKLKYRCVADVEAVPLIWLWPSKVPSGKLTLFAGDPGLGKSFVTIDMASRVSRGKGWPDGSGNQPAGSVIFLACEDDVADTIRPRLERANANLANIYFVDGVAVDDREHGFTLDRHLPVDAGQKT
ncbi:MAG: AAA family ATPase [Planctomycetales bacterium]|jgi:putative DNA primase/helicase